MSGPIGPIDPLQVPRFAGPSTFARLPRLDQVERADVAVVGVPFDAGVTYRPGARFGPIAVRQASRLLRGYHAGLDVMPFASQQVVDAGDIACTPFDIGEAIGQVEGGARELLDAATRIVTIGGDHTIALPLLRALNDRHGLFTPQDLVDDAGFGFKIVSAMDLAEIGVAQTVERIRSRVGDAPMYVSVDIDVLDPAFAPGTGTPEAGGLTSRELLGILRGLKGTNLVGADVVEVAPPYDHAEVTAVAASHVTYELVSLFAVTRA